MSHAAPPPNDALAMMRYDADKKSVLVAYILWFFLGWLGAHRFYLGRVPTAVAQFALCAVSWILSFVLIGYLGFALLGLWWLLDAVLIPGMAQRHNNALIASLRA